jgi:hypothetical protein
LYFFLLPSFSPLMLTRFAGSLARRTAIAPFVPLDTG